MEVKRKLISSSSLGKEHNRRMTHKVVAIQGHYDKNFSCLNSGSQEGHS
jgi:hypothetical protein